MATDQELKQIFDLMQTKLSQCSIGDRFQNELKERRSCQFDKTKPDAYFFEILVRDIHNAGMKAAVVTAKMPEFKKAFSDFNIDKVSQYRKTEFDALLANPKIIRNQRKLRDCIINANIMLAISKNNGSFGEYIDQNKHNSAQLTELMQQFNSVGPAVALDFLKDIGLDFIKPDVHVLRIFSRLGLINSETDFSGALEVAEQFRKATSENLSVIDAVFWMYGGGGDDHIDRAICNKNSPLCDECPLTMCKN